VTLVVSSEINAIIFSDTMQRVIRVSAVPEAGLLLQAPCVMAPTRFFDASATNGVDIASWQWDFGDPASLNDTSSLSDPAWSYNQTGTYSVQLIVENLNGCTDTVLSDITIYNNPEAGFSSSVACAGGMTLFSDESIPSDADLSNWLWSFGNGESSAIQSPYHIYSDTGDYLVQMIVTDQNQCSDTALSALTVFPVPLSAFGIVNNYQNIQGQILLDNTSENAVRYEWDFGNGDTSELFSPVVRYGDDGEYLIQLVAWNDNNCPDTAYMEYAIVFQGLYVPTGFVPDSKDELLSRWKPVGINLESYQVTIINERGNIVWQSDKLDENGMPTEGWDGKTDGEPQPIGNYLWQIKAKFTDGRQWNGSDAGDGNTKTCGYLLLMR
jgi:PKD repeat protein